MERKSTTNKNTLDDLLFQIEMLNNNKYYPIGEKKERFLFLITKKINNLSTNDCITLYEEYITNFNNKKTSSIFTFIYTSRLPKTCLTYLYINYSSQKQLYTKTHKIFLGLIKEKILYDLQEYARKNQFLDGEYVNILKNSIPIFKTQRGSIPNIYIKIKINQGYQGRFNKFYNQIKPRLPYCPVKTNSP